MGIFMCNYYEILYNTKYCSQNWSRRNQCLKDPGKHFFSKKKIRIQNKALYNYYMTSSRVRWSNLLANNFRKTNNGTGRRSTNTSQPSESPEDSQNSTSALTNSPYGESGQHRPARHMASWTNLVWLTIWRSRLNHVDIMHSHLIYVALSSKSRPHCLLFRLDWSYRWNFTVKTAKTYFLV